MRRVFAFSLLCAAVLAVVLFVVFWDNKDPKLLESGLRGTSTEAGLDQASGGKPVGESKVGEESEPALADVERSEISSEQSQTGVMDPSTPAALHVRLVDSGGKAVSNCTAELNYSDSRDTSRFDLAMIMDRVNNKEQPDAISVKADENGTISLNDLETGKELILTVGGSYWSKRKLQVAALDPGETRELGDQILSPGVLLTGRILDPAGEGIPNAKIQLSDLNSKNEFSFGMGGIPGEFRGDTRTDEDGGFEIKGVRLGSYTLEANAPGFVLASTSVELGEGRKDHSVELHLASGGFVTGVVRDDDGKPLPGAKVALVKSRGFSMYQWDHDRVMEEGLQVEQDGSFRLAGLPAEGKWRVVAAAEGFARGRSETVAPGAKMEVELEPQITLSGSLHDSHGLAVEDAEIRLVPQSSNPSRDFFRRSSVTTDENGTFAFDDLNAGIFTLEATSSAGVLSMENVEVGHDSEPLELVLPAAEALIITVMAADGQPLEGALVRLQSSNASDGRQMITLGGGSAMRISSNSDEENDLGARARSAKSDAHGQIPFAGLASGEWTLTAKLENYASLPVVIQRKVDEQQFEKITLHPSAKIRLTALDVTGTPVSGAKVVLTQDGETGFKSRHGNTDPWGLHVWSDLPPGVYRISESNEEKTGMVFLGAHFDDGEEENTETRASNEVVLELKSGEFTEQQIIMAAKVIPTILVTRMGVPVSSANVVLVKEGSFGSFTNFGGIDESAPSGQTDAQGLAVLPPCDAGKYTIEGRATSASPPTKMEVLLQPGQQQVVLELATGIVTGTVMGNSGPLQGAQVRLNQVQEGGSPRANVAMAFSVSMGGDDDDSEVQTMEFSPGQTTATTDEKGQFRFQDVPAGNYEVKLIHKGYISMTPDAKEYGGVGQMDYGLLQMEAGATLKGRVVGLPSDDEEPGTMSMKLLEIRDEEDNRVQMSVLRRKNEFTFQDLKPGAYYLLLSTNDEEHRSDMIQVKSGNPTQFTFTL